MTVDLLESVRGHLRTDAPKILIQQTVGEALDALKTVPPSGPILYFYVIGSSGLLRGVVPTRSLLLEPNSRPLAEILVRDVLVIPDTATLLEAGQLLMQVKLMALPVVDSAGKMLGTIDSQVYGNQLAAVADARSRDNLFQRIGVHLADAQPQSALSAFRHRFPWLGCNLGAGILAAFLSGFYQEELSKAVALAFFIPVVLNLAESVSSQSVSLALELLQGEVPSWSSMRPKLRREGTTGLLLGLGSGLIVGLVALAWLHQWRVAACLLGGIAGGVAGAAVLGLAMPYATTPMGLRRSWLKTAMRLSRISTAVAVCQLPDEARWP